MSDPVDLRQPSQPKIDWAALALQAQQAGLLATFPAPGVQIPTVSQPDFSVRVTPQDGVRPEPTPWTNTGIRLLGGVLGGLAGTPLGPVGIASGAALGTTLASNEWAQPREAIQGTREGVNPLAGFAEGASTMLPIARFSGLASLPRVAASAAGGSALGSAGVQLAETGTIDPSRTVQETAFGTVLGTGIPVGLAATRAAATSPAVQRLASNEAGAVGPNDPLKWRIPVRPATRKNVEAHFRQAPGPIKSAVRDLLGDSGTPNFDRLLKAAQSGEPKATEALGLLRLDPTAQITGKAKATRPVTPTKVAQPVAPEPVAAPVDAQPPAPAPPPDVPVTAAAAPDPSPRPTVKQSLSVAPFSPERPLDPTNLPADIPPRGGQTPALVAEDIERTTRRNVAFLGMDETTARDLAVRSATPEAWVARRRVMPLDEIRARGNELEATLPKKGETFNAEQQSALQDHVAGLYDSIDTLNQEIGDLDQLRAGVLANDPAAVAKVTDLSAKLGVQGLPGIERARLEAFDELAKWQLADEQVGSEWGRSGRARQMLARARKLDDVEFLKQAYDMGLPKPEALDALAKLRGNPEAQRQFLIDLYKPSGQDYWKAYLAFNMLSGPPTMAVNLVSNLLNYARKEAGAIQTAGMDRLTSTERGLQLPPARLLVQSYADGMRHAGRAFAEAMRTGTTALETGSLADSTPEVFKGSWLAKGLQASGVEQEIANRYGRAAVNVIKRTLLGTDAAFQMMGIYPEAYRRATAEAWNTGLRGQALVDDIQRRIQGLDLHSDASKGIREYAKSITFSEESGPVSKMFQKFTRSVDDLTVRMADKAWTARTGTAPAKSGSQYGMLQYPLGFAHVPFARIAGNLFKQAVQIAVTDPAVGAFNLGARQGNRVENLRRVAQASQAYALAGVLASLYEAGVIDFTSRAPENDFERQQFYGPQGKTPWAIGINGHYIPLTTMGSLGMALAPLAAYLKGLGGEGEQTKFTEVAAALGKVTLDATTARSVMTLFQGLTDDRKQEQLLGNYVAQLVPAGSMARTVRDVVDPTLRDPGGKGAERRFAGSALAPVAPVVEEIEAQVPGLSANVRPRLDSFGRPIERQPPTKRVLGSSSRGADYVGAELLALKESLPDIARENEGVYPPDLKASVDAFEKSLEGAINKQITDPARKQPIRLTDEERQRYMRLVGRATHAALSQVITPENAKWTDLTPQQKKAAVQTIKRQAKRVATQSFVRHWVTERYGR